MVSRSLVLEGKFVRLEPLSASHAIDLWRLADEVTLAYLNLWHPVSTEDAMAELINRVLNAEESVFFAVIDRGTGQAVGSTSYLDLRPAHRSLEIGNTWIGREAQGTAINPEMKLLLLEHAFESLDCVRVQLKTDARNVQSQAAMRKLGAVCEGTLRQHLICRDGFIRDTVMFSITDDEWPTVREGLRERLTTP
ncbi:MAG: GNAT family N-acetyltransferase [Methanoregulaceae archaeon]|nr:GNAT family N-acetyltransferase [Methanoregulaceae archaeon]